MAYLTQPYTLELRAFCGHGIYLRWLTSLGDWSGFLFDGDIDDNTPAPAASSFQPAKGAAVKLRSEGRNRQLLRVGNLTPAQHAVLSTLHDSPQVYIQSATGQLTSVTVVPAATGRTSSETRTEFDVEIDLGPRNALSRI